jgi:1,2-diacylglycerol 3-beta-glucosyltransferase
MSLLDVVLTLIVVPAALPAAYVGVLAVAARRWIRLVAPRPHLKLDVIIPAHDEEGGIAATVASALSVSYPPDLFRVVVIADNCSDRTAERAIRAGAHVLVREAPAARGKGQALAFAFDRLLEEGCAEAFVVIDADTTVSTNLLSAFAERLENGAGALQGDYGVGDSDRAWRTRLMRLAFTAFHTVRSLARERLGLSCGLRGNGMAFKASVVRAVPPRAFSIVEDLEYGIALGRAGVRVEYVPEAKVFGAMCGGERNSRSQRYRWEDGRALIAKSLAWSLLLQGCRRRDRVLLDLAIDLLVPSLSRMVGMMLAAVLLVGIFAGSGTPVPVAAGAAGLGVLGIVLYIGRAAQLTGRPMRALADLMWAPAYLAWKVWLVVLREPSSAPVRWIRTTRE